jgi:hypothetical protein
VDYVPEPGVLYRKHPGSIQLDIERWVRNDLRAMEMIFSLPRARSRTDLLRAQRHRIHSEAGVRYFYQGEHARARTHLWQSLKYKNSPLVWTYLAKSLLPSHFLSARRQHGQVAGIA